MNIKATLKGNSAIKILILIPIIFPVAHVLRTGTEEYEALNKASTIARKDDSLFSSHSLAASVDSTRESENSLTVSQKIKISPNGSINEPGLFTASPEASGARSIAEQEVYYSYARPDRSGAAIHDMLMCHALAFSRGSKYGGSCPKNESKAVHPDRITSRKKLLRMLGIDFSVNSECPRGANIVGGSEYYGKPELFSPEYMDHLRSTSKSSAVDRSPRAPRITVHIRRGDVEPCGRTGFRYLPNSHYLGLIDSYTSILKQRIKHTGVNYASEEIEVVILSESRSYESFDVFRSLGHKVLLDGPLDQAWKYIIFNSDVVILSLSSFSLVPGILSLALSPNPTTVVYTPFWHVPLAQFDNMGDLYPELLAATEAELKSICEKN